MNWSFAVGIVIGVLAVLIPYGRHIKRRKAFQRQMDIDRMRAQELERKILGGI